MKALMRGEEIICEPFPPWIEAHIEWMTGNMKDVFGNPLKGGGWQLIEDYDPPVYSETEEQRHVL